MIGRCVVLSNAPAPENQSSQYIGYPPDPGREPTCANFSHYAQLYDIKRKSCQGTWSITRGGVQLVDGFCSRDALLAEKQLIITDTYLFVGYFYLSSLTEMLRMFGTKRNASSWKNASEAAAMASMLWARITVLQGPGKLAKSNAAPLWVAGNQTVTNLTMEDVGLIYPVDDHVAYIRPTLQKSPWLCVILAVQPVMTVVMIGLIAMLHSVPIDKGFGMVSILSGINRGSLGMLEGAGLSGEMKEG